MGYQSPSADEKVDNILLMVGKRLSGFFEAEKFETMKRVMLLLMTLWYSSMHAH